jgi:hypothetical protein
LSIFADVVPGLAPRPIEKLSEPPDDGASELVAEVLEPSDDVMLTLEPKLVEEPNVN